MSLVVLRKNKWWGWKSQSIMHLDKKYTTYGILMTHTSSYGQFINNRFWSNLLWEFFF